jgi:hypothetical protein
MSELETARQRHLDQTEDEELHVVLVGDLSSGFRVAGPFAGYEEAFEWTCSQFTSWNTWIMPLEDPAKFITENGELPF